MSSRRSLANHRHVLDLHVETTGGVQTVTMYEVNRFVSSEPSGALQDTGLPSLAVYSSAGGGGGDPNCGVVPSPTPAPSMEVGSCTLTPPGSSLSTPLATSPTVAASALDTVLSDLCVSADISWWFVLPDLRFVVLLCCCSCGIVRANTNLGVSHLATIYAGEDLRTITTDFTSRVETLAGTLSERLLSKATAVSAWPRLCRAVWVALHLWPVLPYRRSATFARRWRATPPAPARTPRAATRRRRRRRHPALDHWPSTWTRRAAVCRRQLTLTARKCCSRGGTRTVLTASSSTSSTRTKASRLST